MAYFRKLKLDPNFEDWLDAKILKLKAEGVIESDPEEEEEAEERADQGGGAQDGVSGHEWPESDPPWEQEPEYDELPSMSSGIYRAQNGDDDMAVVSSGGKLTPAPEPEVGDDGFRQHVSTEVGGDYYQFVWESEEEADIFDREEYQLGHHSGTLPGDGTYTHVEPEVRIAHPQDLYNERVGERYDDVDGPAGEEYRSPNGVSARGRGGMLGGLVLGVGRKDVQVAYTQLQDTRPDVFNPRQDSAGFIEQDWEFQEDSLPDPRFSITDMTADAQPNDVPMLEMGSSSGARPLQRHSRSARVRDSGSGPTARRTEKSQLRLPPGGSQDGGALPGQPANGTTYRDRVMLPMNSMEMTLTSDDDDDIIDDDNFDVHSELAPDTSPIVTVDQATLVEQWRSKSKRTRTAIIAGVVCGVVLVFSVVTYLIVHILTTTW